MILFTNVSDRPITLKPGSLVAEADMCSNWCKISKIKTVSASQQVPQFTRICGLGTCEEEKH